MLSLVQSDYVVIRQLDGNLSTSHIFALLPVTESDGATHSSRVVQKTLDVRGHVKCGAGIQQPHLCILRTVMNFSDRRVQ